MGEANVRKNRVVRMANIFIWLGLQFLELISMIVKLGKNQ
ncbi:hypothetical protein A33Q_1922 [Indibacter alkaliphilus LW1]|uniref:Uncharacterized protein n=1 Tax=Indibacter alkaliphilus (strain CCUG 57479 / KCTC 22604 / LW1) TaxID=1189612 RepID=S2DDM4_INDAL|nr:hypothetical protein A33Q_1922 [Indibacter alkaliphilus LW1]